MIVLNRGALRRRGAPGNFLREKSRRSALAGFGFAAAHVLAAAHLACRVQTRREEKEGRQTKGRAHGKGEGSKAKRVVSVLYFADAPTDVEREDTSLLIVLLLVCVYSLQMTCKVGANRAKRTQGFLCWAACPFHEWTQR